jgi:hypothetical protein
LRSTKRRLARKKPSELISKSTDYEPEPVPF